MEFDSFLNLDFISCFSVAEWLDDNTDYAWGIFKNDELIGYCTIGIADDMDAIVESHPEHTVDSLCISDVYIEKRYRHKGYGTQLKIGFKPLDEPDGNFSGDMVLSISDGRVPRHRSDCTAWVWRLHTICSFTGRSAYLVDKKGCYISQPGKTYKQ